MHQAATATRESPYYKRLIDELCSSSSINRLRLLLQFAFRASRFAAWKAILLSASSTGNAAQRAIGAAAAGLTTVANNGVETRSYGTKSTTEKSESAYKPRVFAKRHDCISQCTSRGAPAACRRSRVSGHALAS
jgi:hypothetical protein